ncbi:RdgB/HAM1 family non-canonical purine NTP pyrophosphatase [Salinibius halmophilus]|uniref:RdgB/HAM1 family non-canonical purine NTP pyrophosphatase n=1 Tax=Salinibius halmophilus TaxID=1853216 RepID=UPI000E67508F|nr:RdgB/HAM1 family non-canonical purine NTP pyrophosphatase [Salinibius halmophilus]
MSKTIVLATGNQGKVAELQNLLAPKGFDVVPQSDFVVTSVEETGLTYVENALLKARNVCRLTGQPALADDSGLSVKVLNGAPGLYSARYAGAQASDQDNIDKLLSDLANEEHRLATFHCVLVYLRHEHDPAPIIAHGQWHGHILRAPRGEGGFGYDPVFYDSNLGKAAAELTREEKAAVSHRGKALAQLMEQLA